MSSAGAQRAPVEDSTLSSLLAMPRMPTELADSLVDLIRAPRGLRGAVGREIAGRYTLRALIGQGGMGEVWRAVDRIGGAEVAVKLVPALAPIEQEQVRREVAALRWLRLPGVVQLLDDGDVDQSRFLVMELVEGQPFLDQRARWGDVAAPTLELLENLARVHFAGVVHRDLKPANVRLDPHGHPILLDFGIARGAAIGGGTVGVEGTPFTMAPEVLAGRPCDARADLYAIGVMLYFALSGKTPHDGSPEAILRAERVPLKTYAPSLPTEVRRTIDALVAIDPDERPSTALEVLARFGGHPPPAFAPAADAADWTALRPLFHGQDGFLHVQEDASVVLWERTGGQKERVARELAGWIRSGLAHWLGEEVKIDRAAVERLRAGLRLGGAPDLSGLGPEACALYRRLQLEWPDAPVVDGPAWDELAGRGLAWRLPDGRAGVDPYVRPADDAAEHLRIAAGLPSGERRLRHLVAGEAPAALVADDSAQVAAKLRMRGQLGKALAVAELGLAAAAAGSLPTLTDALLCELVVATLSQESQPAFDRCLYALGRSTLRSPLVTDLEALVRGFSLAARGEGSRAQEILAAVRSFEDRELEGWRVGANVRASTHNQCLTEQEQLLEDVGQWASVCEEWTIRRAIWLGNLRYSQGRFEEAAVLFADAAAAASTSEARRLAASVNEAGAWLETVDTERAFVAATRALAAAQVLRLPEHEARADNIRRMALYRRGLALVADARAVDAAEALGDYHVAQRALTEAAIAWRNGDLLVARAIAERGRTAAERSGRTTLYLLTSALRAASAGCTPVECADLARRASDWQVPAVTAQVLGLLRRADTAHGDELRKAIEQLPLPSGAEQRLARLDVLSIAECTEDPR